MRICFIADSSSIHVQRIVASYVQNKDDILILSTGLKEFYVEGTTTRHLLKTTARSVAWRDPRDTADRRFLAKLKQLFPRRLRGYLKRTIRNLGLFRERVACRREIERFNPDVIYCFRSFPEGMLAAFCHVRPLLLRTAGADISKFAKYPVYKQFIRKALQAADVVVTESLWEKRLLQVLCGDTVNPEVNIIGIDTKVFRPSSARQRLREKYALSRDAFVVVSNRYLRGDYNGWLVVEAIKSILLDCPKLVLLYLSPASVDPYTRAKVELISAQFPQIRFMDGGVPHSEVAEILGCGDIYISLSSVDGISNSILEAMACGCVPIVADLPQLHEWIEPGSTGFIVPQRDRQKVGLLVKKLYQRPDELAPIASRCVSKIETDGRFEVCMARTTGILKSLVFAASQETRESASVVDPSHETTSLYR